MRKTLMLAALVAITGSAVAQAQGGPPGPRGMGRGGPGGGMMLDRVLFKDITLSDAQKAKLEELRIAEREKMRADSGRGRGGENFEAIRTARQNGDTATANRLMAEQRAKMDEQRDVRIATLRTILTSDQVAQFDANVAEFKKRESEMGLRGGAGGRGRRGGPPPA
jgi:Spy/CpxP family protein refolding chaperone